MKKRKQAYRLAVGLDYDSTSESAPNIGIKARDYLADEVVRLARRYSVPVVERPGLAKALEQLDLDQAIPEELYHAVAVLLNELERRVG